MLKKYARRAVQLGHDDPFGSVDDEGALAGHQGHFAHVDFLFLDLFDHLVLGGGSFAVINDQLHFGAHGRGVGESAGLALAHVKARFRQVVLEVFHLDKTVVRNDREGRLEGRLQALCGAFFRRSIGLQKRCVGVFLHLQQVGYFEHAVTIAEIFSNAFAFGVRVSHEISGQ